jgi:hypothetical protein
MYPNPDHVWGHPRLWHLGVWWGHPGVVSGVVASGVVAWVATWAVAWVAAAQGGRILEFLRVLSLIR